MSVNNFRVLFISILAAILSVIPNNIVAQNSEKKFTPVLKLPHPTGDYDIGSLRFKIADGTTDHMKRNILFQVWYPAALSNYNPDYYLPGDLFRTMDYVNYQQIDSLNFMHWKNISNHSTPGAPIKTKKYFPIIFFIPAQGMSQFNYTSLIEDIVSKGFVVISMDSPDMHFMAFSGSDDYFELQQQKITTAQIRVVADDVNKVYNWIENSGDPELSLLRRSIDFNKAGIMGHKSGGTVAIEVSKSDHRFTACVNLGGTPVSNTLKSGLKKPSMVFLEENSMNVNSNANAWKKVFAKDASVPAFVLSIDNANAYTYTDFPFLTDAFFNDKTNANEVGKRHERLLTINAYIHSFFEQYLGIQPSFKVRKLLKEYDESTLLATTEKF